MIKQCAILFGCLTIGELIVWLTGIKLPSSIIGMLLLTTLLHFKIIKIEWIKGITDFLIDNLGFFFIPPGVAIMLYFNVIKAQFLPIALATVISTALVLIATSKTHRWIRVLQQKIYRNINNNTKSKNGLS